MGVAFGRVTLAAAAWPPVAWRRGSLVQLTRHQAALFAFALVEFAAPFKVISIGERWIACSARRAAGLGGYLAFALVLLGCWLATRGSAAAH